MLQINREDIGAIAQMVRIELKRKDDRQAAIYAQKAIELDSNNISAIEAQSMVYFYNNKIDLSKNLLSKIKKQEITMGDSSISTRLSSIINGSEVFR